MSEFHIFFRDKDANMFNYVGTQEARNCYVAALKFTAGNRIGQIWKKEFPQNIADLGFGESKLYSMEGLNKKRKYIFVAEESKFNQRVLAREQTKKLFVYP